MSQTRMKRNGIKKKAIIYMLDIFTDAMEKKVVEKQKTFEQ
jgi:hypothetical protein